MKQQYEIESALESMFAGVCIAVPSVAAWMGGFHVTGYVFGGASVLWFVVGVATLLVR